MFTPAVGSGWRTLATGGSLEDLIGYSGPQSRWLCSWLSENIVRMNGAKIEWRGEDEERDDEEPNAAGRTLKE